MSFDGLGLAPELLRSVAHEGYTEPTPVQREAIPLVLAGRDLLAGAQTGTGKTAAFVLPMLQLLHASRVPGRPAVRSLILAPTRELALQVEASVRTYGAQRPIRSTTIYGGVGFDPQVRALRAGPEIVVATPGRLLDHLGQGTIDLSRVEILVLDEADRMLDMGFAVEMAQIMEYVPAERQTMLFSATIPLGIRALIYHYMAEPEWVLLSEDQIYVKEVEHVYCLTSRLHKEATLYRLLEYENPSSSMIFCNTREETRVVATFLRNKGLAVAMLSSDLPQRKREQVMAGF
ncbi:MAG TPA: DEAD/DEAH box helicase, partial [Candidatus Limnocylindrales bacterium]